MICGACWREAMNQQKIILFYAIIGEICIAIWLFKRVEVWDYIVDRIASVWEWVRKLWPL
jgi:hypothetical protein